MRIRWRIWRGSGSQKPPPINLSSFDKPSPAFGAPYRAYYCRYRRWDAIRRHLATEAVIMATVEKTERLDSRTRAAADSPAPHVPLQLQSGNASRYNGLWGQQTCVIVATGSRSTHALSVTADATLAYCVWHIL
ncbi:unnamed protein product, partial [Iphiclides podalirius]